MGDTAASKARCFCVLFVLHLAQILLRTATVSLLAATRGWLAAVYLVGDYVVMVAYTPFGGTSCTGCRNSACRSRY